MDFLKLAQLCNAVKKMTPPLFLFGFRHGSILSRESPADKKQKVERCISAHDFDPTGRIIFTLQRTPRSSFSPALELKSCLTSFANIIFKGSNRVSVVVIFHFNCITFLSAGLHSVPYSCVFELYTSDVA